MDRKNYKAIIADFDGTLVRKDLEINPYLLKAINKWTSAGKYFSIATGKALTDTLLKSTKPIEHISPYIVNGGAEIIDVKKDKILNRQCISENRAKEIIKTLLNQQLRFVAVRDNKLYASSNKDQKLTNKFSYIDVNRLAEFNHIVKIRIVIEMENLKKIKHFIKKIQTDSSLFITTNKTALTNNYDITNHSATKYEAVWRLTKMLSIDTAEVIGIGDDYNDIPLLKAVGLKVTFEDSPAEIKKIANLILPHRRNSIAALILRCLKN